ncbi:olfactory receptor 52B2-like [Dendropsophus ebraccatus]|uniref:olfactory receptor 52B2-like n=1 Tax=Dendropsophus ebraccatus TaxID=150705 RepID=UPI00383189A5
MEMLNMTAFHPDYFLLMGIPGLEESHLLLSIPFCIMYVTALLGNSILVIGTNKSLQQPMYLFLKMLAACDILLSSTTVPKTLCIFWFSSHEILFDCCLIQLFFIHYLFVIESSILLTMAYDRYIAICSPLSYTTIITSSFIRKATLIAIIRAFCIITPLVLLLNRLPYSGSNVIAHTYCEHIAVAHRATADITVNSVYGLAAAFSSTGVDLILIAVSYGVIIQTVLRLPSSEARSKAFNTSMSHVCVIILFYIPAFFSFIAHRVAQGKIPPSAYIMVANLYVIIPPMMNPIIYGIRTREIRHRLAATLCKNMRKNSFSVFSVGQKIRPF